MELSSETCYWRKDKGTERRGRRCNQLHYGNKWVLEIETRRTRSQSVENSVWKRLRACRKTNCVMMMMMMIMITATTTMIMMMMMTTCGLCLENAHTEGKQGFGTFLSLQHSSVACILLVSAVAFTPISLLRINSFYTSALFLATRLLPNVTHRNTFWEDSSCSPIFEVCYLQLWPTAQFICSR